MSLCNKATEWNNLITLNISLTMQNEVTLGITTFPNNYVLFC